MQILLRSMRGIFKKIITKRLTVSQPLLLVEKDNFNKGTPSLAGRCPTPHQRLCLWNPLKG